ncbi:hypothetical protein I5M32_05930 [Pedobacter sp. SD-b]|uniref:Tetratricopeptide repeat-containing protein n=1 Tax=Pedobacter segetis TaxID=2793069 RepID=A0ABS1BJH3_9SPHI|nr:hypothetical protein [Pedobacter segetis]MBK0382496.1 hypothetical protein [Pedobacter segetis]
MENQNLENIIRYVNGEMQANEKEVFEQELATNINLKEDLLLYLNVDKTLRSEFSNNKTDRAFKENLVSLNQQYFKAEQKPTAKIIKINRLWYAAAILIVGLLIWAPWNHDIYDKYADTEMVSFAERGAVNQDNLQAATDAFNAKDFNKAKGLLQPLVKENPDDDMLKFYLGLTQFQTKEYEKAKSNFTTVNKRASIFKYDAAFYMALTYLKQDNKAEAKVWLNKIPKDSDEHQKAKDILDNL